MNLYLEKRPLCHSFAIASNSLTTGEWDFWGVIPPQLPLDNGYKPNPLAIISRNAYLLNECGGIIQTLSLPLTETMYHYGDGTTGTVQLHLKDIQQKTVTPIIGKYCFAYKICWDDNTCYTYYSDWFYDYDCYINVATIMPCLDLSDISKQKDINGSQAGEYDQSIYPQITGRNIWHIFNNPRLNLVYIPKIFLRCGFFFTQDYQYEFTIKANRSLKTDRTKILKIKPEEVGDFYTPEIDVVLSFGKIIVLDKKTNEANPYTINAASMPIKEAKWKSRYHTLEIESQENAKMWRGCTTRCYYEILSP